MSNIETELDRLTKPLQRLREEALVEQEELKQKLAANREKLGKLNRVLNAVNPEPRQEKKVKPKKATAKRPSEEALQAIATAVYEGAETVNEVADVTGYTPNTCRVGLEHLRQDEIVRKAGLRGRTVLYKPMKLTDADLKELVANG